MWFKIEYTCERLTPTIAYHSHRTLNGGGRGLANGEV
jgi:hypothetical protein